MRQFRIVITVIFVLLSSNSLNAQSYKYGLEISPSFDFQLQSANNGAWQAIRGNGFLLGAFFDKNIGEHSFIETGLKFEYIAFNDKSGDFLISSFRISSLNVPLLFKQEIGLTQNWFYNAGIGLNYNFLNRQFFTGNWFNANNAVNQWQPYANLGINYLMDERFELGMCARYHFINLFKDDPIVSNPTTSKLFSLDFSLRYTLASH